MPVRMASLVPARKVWAGGLAGIAAWVLTAALRQYAGIDLPEELSELIIAMVMPTVAYLVPPAARDVVVQIDERVRALGQEPAP